MLIRDAISMVLLITLGTDFISKLIMMKRRDRIDANVLARGGGKGAAGKETATVRSEMFVRLSTAVWIIVWIGEILLHSWLSDIFGFFFNNLASSIIGLVLTALGITILISAIVYMKNSWRVGIDKSTKTALIRDGVYRYSRNPAFVGFDLIFLGVFVTYANILTLITMLLCILALHLLILQEERHLMSVFGKEYAEYNENTPRYFLKFNHISL